MTRFQLPSAYFPDNAITRAERLYQEHSVKKTRAWRRWLTRFIIWLAITVSLIMFGALLIASLTQDDPSRLTKSLGLNPYLLMFFTFLYHLYLMFQTIALAANSITREKEARTWELVVLTGIDAHQIVRGKWWATIQRQLPRYLLLGLFRAGATAALAINFAWVDNYEGGYYSQILQLPHPLTLAIAGLLGIALTLADLALSAACGVMGSAISKRGTFAIMRGFVIQIVITILPVLVMIFGFSLFITDYYFSSLYKFFSRLGLGLIDNGFTLLVNSLGHQHSDYSEIIYSRIIPIPIEYLISTLIILFLYALLTWFALWRAEKRVVKSLVSPAD